mgnify:CR=1 FL=1
MSTPDFSLLTEADVRDNPQLDQATLKTVAHSRPDLRATVRQHPNCYQDLADWIDSQPGVGQQVLQQYGENHDQNQYEQQSYAPSHYDQPSSKVSRPKRWTEWLPVMIAGLALLGIVALFFPLGKLEVAHQTGYSGFFLTADKLKGARLISDGVIVLAIISMILVAAAAVVQVVAFFVRRKALALIYPIAGIVAGALGLITYIVALIEIYSNLILLRGIVEAFGQSWESSGHGMDVGFGAYFGMVVFGLLLAAGVFALVMERKGRGLSANIQPVVSAPGPVADEAPSEAR